MTLRDRGGNVNGDLLEMVTGEMRGAVRKNINIFEDFWRGCDLPADWSGAHSGAGKGFRFGILRGPSAG
jgi:hypothetical protein